MNLPCVSVIIATYRRDNTLKAALESLAAQTYGNLEIIVVDDNNDSEWNLRVKKIIESFRNDNKSLQVILLANTEHLGSSETRNKGIEVSHGEYVTFLDDDDYYLPNKCESQLKFMLNNDCDFSITDLDLINEKGKLIETRTRSYIKDFSPIALMRYHLMYHMTGTDTIMFRRKYLLKINGFDPINIGDEFYLVQKAILGGGKFGYLAERSVIAIVHKGDGGLSSGEGKINGENTLYEYKKKFFAEIDSKSVRYIKMRHYAVISYAYYRMGRYFKCIQFLFFLFCSSPIQSVKTGAKILLKNRY